MIPDAIMYLKYSNNIRNALITILPPMRLSGTLNSFITLSIKSIDDDDDDDNDDDGLLSYERSKSNSNPNPIPNPSLFSKSQHPLYTNIPSILEAARVLNDDENASVIVILISIDTNG